MKPNKKIDVIGGIHGRCDGFKFSLTKQGYQWDGESDWQAYRFVFLEGEA